MNDNDAVVVVSTASRELRRVLRPIEWVVLEDVALDARPDANGAMVAATSARRVAEHLDLTPGAVGKALARLRSAGLVIHARHPGLAGRFGLSAYELAPVCGLTILDTATTTVGVAPSLEAPRTDDPRMDHPRMDPPPVVKRHVVETVSDERSQPIGWGPTAPSRSRSKPTGASVVASIGADDSAENGPARVAAKAPLRRRRASSERRVDQLSILDIEDRSGGLTDHELADQELSERLDTPERHR